MRKFLLSSQVELSLENFQGLESAEINLTFTPCQTIRKQHTSMCGDTTVGVFQEVKWHSLFEMIICPVFVIQGEKTRCSNTVVKIV